jgi:Bifunctional DNA primase/polymerase, N-terminal
MPMPAMTQREIRKALLQNGHLPIPVQGKRPLLLNWQNLSPNEEMIDAWGEQGDNTGVLCKRTAALDIDFDDAAAVQIILDLFRKGFQQRCQAGWYARRIWGFFMRLPAFPASARHDGAVLTPLQIRRDLKYLRKYHHPAT